VHFLSKEDPLFGPHYLKDGIVVGPKKFEAIRG
jgi:hypothetical protein